MLTDYFPVIGVSEESMNIQPSGHRQEKAVTVAAKTGKFTA